MADEVKDCTKDECGRSATWFVVRISNPSEQIPTCKRHISAQIVGREEHAVYPISLRPTVMEDGEDG